MWCDDGKVTVSVAIELISDSLNKAVQKNSLKMQEITGILNIDKPQQMTSHDVVAILRRKLGIKRIGHTGTLDPMATGVLPVCIGKATRIIEYLDLDYKVYDCKIEFGIETDTEDIWGEILKKDISAAADITKEQLEKVCDEFTGWISQVPPMYSALKVNGRKLYEYARNGETVDVKARDVYIDKIKVTDFNTDVINSIGENVPTASLQIRCGKGTYIRSLCRDIGRKLNSLAVMSGLRRIQTGVFSESDSISIEKIRDLDKKEILKLFLTEDTALVHLGKGIVKLNRVKWFVNGGRLKDFEVKVAKEPLSDILHAPVRETGKYKNEYCLYGKISNDPVMNYDPCACPDADNEKTVFLGTAIFDPEKKEYKADKIFFNSCI